MAKFLTFDLELEGWRSVSKYRAFLPTKVCHAWDMSDAELTDLLGKADRALGELNAFSQLIPDIDFFIRMHVAKEATQSSRLEGTQTNIEDAFKDLSDLEPEGRDDWSEVQNYIGAINGAIKSLEKLPLSNRLLCETHAMLMAVRQGNHLRAWLVFFLHGVEETARASAQVFRSILSIKQRIDTEVLPSFTTRRQENAQKLMLHLYAHPVVDVKWVSQLLETTANTASAMIQDLVKHGVLKEGTGKRRNRLFLFTEYIALFK